MSAAIYGAAAALQGASIGQQANREYANTARDAEEGISSILPRVLKCAMHACQQSSHIRETLGLYEKQSQDAAALPPDPSRPTLYPSLKMLERLLGEIIKNNEATLSHLNN